MGKVPASGSIVSFWPATEMLKPEGIWSFVMPVKVLLTVIKAESSMPLAFAGALEGGVATVAADAVRWTPSSGQTIPLGSLLL